nr:probable mitochondrial adenine nucleotide transporter BTL1 [Ipomoea batatas]
MAVESKSQKKNLAPSSSIQQWQEQRASSCVPDVGRAFQDFINSREVCEFLSGALAGTMTKAILFLLKPSGQGWWLVLDPKALVRVSSKSYVEQQGFGKDYGLHNPTADFLPFFAIPIGHVGHGQIRVKGGRRIPSILPAIITLIATTSGSWIPRNRLDSFSGSTKIVVGVGSRNPHLSETPISWRALSNSLERRTAFFVEGRDERGLCEIELPVNHFPAGTKSSASTMCRHYLAQMIHRFPKCPCV